MRKSFFISVLGLCVAGVFCTPVRAQEAYAFDRWHAGTGAGLFLPGNAGSLRRASSVSAWIGYYLTETFALCADLQSVPHAAGGGGATVTGAGLSARLHATRFEAYDRLFGSERLDPFFSAGLGALFASRAVFADASHRTAMGPYLGIGSFYHLTDRASLCAEARASLACEAPCGMNYSIVLGIQWSFGAGE